MDFFGIDYTTIIDWVQQHDPKAVPYLQFLLYVVPIILIVCGKIARHLPVPGYQIVLFSDTDIEGKFPNFLVNPINKLVKISNEFVIFLNFIFSTRPYKWFYTAMYKLGSRINKSEANLPPPPANLTSLPIDNSDIPEHVNADNLTPEEINIRTKLFVSELEKESAKTIRLLAAQRVKERQLSQQAASDPNNKDKPQDPSHG